VGSSANDLDAGRAKLRSDLERARDLAKGRLAELKKAYALDGKPDQLLVVSVASRLAGDKDLAQELCRKYAAIATPSSLLPAGLDEDGDGVPSCADECPTRPGDKKSQDGCPTLDADGDGVLDKDDQCPNEPETINGFHDADGCPDVLSYCETGVGTDGACFSDSASCEYALDQRFGGHNQVLAMGGQCVARGIDGGHHVAKPAPSEARSGSASRPTIEVSPECKANPLAKGCS
jgi:hypothetical protein